MPSGPEGGIRFGLRPGVEGGASVPRRLAKPQAQMAQTDRGALWGEWKWCDCATEMGAAGRNNAVERASARAKGAAQSKA